MAKKGAIGANVTLDGEREFRQAITNINSDMKVLGSEMKKVTAEFADNKDSVEALTAKNTVLNNQIESQTNKVDELRRALENSKEQYGENSTKTKAWQTSLNNSLADLANLNNALNGNERALEQAISPMNRLGNETDDFKDSANGAGQESLKMGDIIKANLISDVIIGGIRALGDAIKDVAIGAIDGSKEAAAYADNILTLSTVTGMSTESLQAYNFAADLVDVSMETLTGSMAKNIKSMSNAQKGTADYVKAYESLGVSVTDSNGKLRDSETVYWETIDALGRMTDETARDAVSMQIFGKSAQELNPLIAQGSDGIAKLTQEAKDMGAVMSDDSVKALGELDDSFQRLDGTTEAAKNKVFAAIAPTMTELATNLTTKIQDLASNFSDFLGKPETQEGLKDIVKGFGDLAEKTLELASDMLPKIINFGKWFVENKDTIIAGLAGIGTGFLVFNVVSIIQGVVGAIKAFQIANEGATIAQWLLNAAMTANPLGIIIAIIGGLVVAIGTLLFTNEDFRTKVIKIWEGVTEAIGNSVLKVVGFFKNNWKEILLLIVNPFAGGFALLYKHNATFRNAVDTLVKNIKNLFTSMGTGISNTMKNVVNAIKNGFNNAITFITSLPSKAVKWGTDFIDGLVKGIKSGITNVKNAVKAVADAITSFLHFSVPDEGPLTEYETWMPDFMDGLAKGISGSKSSVVDSLKSLAGDMSGIMNGIPSELTTSINADVNYNLKQQSINPDQSTALYITNYTTLDGKVIAKETSKQVISDISKQQTTKLRARGAIA